jgi:pyruvate dehydrogenase E2 component (dihydrolipoamide acetyltransferase)
MPALSPTMTSGNLASWLKKEGDSVLAGDTIAQVETDKATVDFEVLDDGIVARLLVADGASDLAVGTPVAVLVEAAEHVAAFKDYVPTAAAPAAAAPAPPKPAAAAPAVAPAAAPAAAAAAPKAAAKSAAVGSGRVPASPLARRMAAAAALDISTVTGSGPNGRVIAADVEAAAAAAAAAPAAPVAAAGAASRDGGPAFVLALALLAKAITDYRSARARVRDGRITDCGVGEDGCRY